MADAQTEHRLQPRTTLRGHLTGAEPCNIKLDRYARHAVAEEVQDQLDWDHARGGCPFPGARQP